MTARGARNRAGRDRRGVAERLVVVVHHLRQRGLEDLRLHRLFVMRGAEGLGDLTRQEPLIEVRPGEADRERLDRMRTEPCHRGDDAARIEPAAEEGAVRHVAAHADPYRIREQARELALDRGGVGSQIRLVDRRQVPVGVDRPAPVLPQQAGCGRQLVDAPEERVGRRQVAQTGVDLHPTQIGAPLDPAGEQALDLGGEQERAVMLRVVEGFLPQAVPRQHQPSPALIPEREGPHAVQMLLAVRAPLFIGAQNHLGVRLGGEDVTERLEFVA